MAPGMALFAGAYPSVDQLKVSCLWLGCGLTRKH
jgi:hypothetical protein